MGPMVQNIEPRLIIILKSSLVKIIEEDLDTLMYIPKVV